VKFFGQDLTELQIMVRSSAAGNAAEARVAP
jgi:hypothetical protein